MTAGPPQAHPQPLAGTDGDERSAMRLASESHVGPRTSRRQAGSTAAQPRAAIEALEPRSMMSAGMSAGGAGDAVETLAAPPRVSRRRVFTDHQDVGSPALAGRATYRRGTYTLTAGGTDIWGAADQFHFAATRLTGDGVVVARVLGLTDTDPWAKAGVMFRETLAADARDAYVTVTPRHRAEFLYRADPGAAAAAAGPPGGTAVTALPTWVKAVRQGDTFTGFWSADGVAWHALGPAVTVDMADTVYVGLAASSHNAGALTTATFADATLLATPATGVYRLSTRGQRGMSLDVEGWGNANGTPVSLFQANHTSNQQWLVEGQGDGTYKVYAYSGRNSLQMLDLVEGRVEDGTPVRTYEDNGNDAQLWSFVPAGRGYWRVVPKNGLGTDRTLEVQGGNRAGSGARTAIAPFRKGKNQLFRLEDPGAPALLASPKKGLAGWPGQIGNVNPAWFYTWGADRPAGVPAGVEFVPMVWGYYGNANGDFDDWLHGVRSQPGVTSILGFNEPDASSQANLSVEGALEAWQYMTQTGLPLGSPAAVHADNQWMRDFMSGAAQRGYRVDYVTVHWYGGDDVDGFLNHVDHIHNLYGKPVWVTEFAPADWSGQRRISPARVADFMRRVLPELDRRAYVQRYSWFSAGTGDAPLGNAALFNDDGSLTALGKLYSRL